MRSAYRILAVACFGTLVGAAVASAAAVDAPPVSAQPERSVAIASSADLGIGETLVVVTDGLLYATREDAEAAAGQRFGEMQGYYVDTTDEYELLAFYDRLSPESLRLPCKGMAPGSCVQDDETTVAHQAVSLVRIDVDDSAYLSAAASRPCGAVDLTPCDARRVQEVFGSPPALARGHWLVLSAFRTKAGAESFFEMASAYGSDPLALQVRKMGGAYIGLGQESDPDGGGPLVEALARQETYQE